MSRHEFELRTSRVVDEHFTPRPLLPGRILLTYKVGKTGGWNCPYYSDFASTFYHFLPYTTLFRVDEPERMATGNVVCKIFFSDWQIRKAPSHFKPRNDVLEKVAIFKALALNIQGPRRNVWSFWKWQKGQYHIFDKNTQI